MPRSLKQQLAARTRQAQAVALRLEGHTFAAIAQQLGFSDASAARKAVVRAVREIGHEEVHTLAALQYERLNDLLSKTWPIATDASHPRCLEAVQTSLRIMEQLDRLVRRDPRV